MQYELMLVVAVDRADQLIGRVEKLVKEADVSDYKLERLGKKTLSYPIKKQTDAAYFVLNFNAPGDWTGTLTEKLRLEQEDLLRFMLLRKVESKVKGKKGKMPSLSKVEGDNQVSEEDREKPKVTVAVKKSSTVKSGKEKVSKGKKTENKKSPKSTKSKKGKNK